MSEGGHPKDFSKFLEDAKNQADTYSSFKLDTDTTPLFEKMPMSQQISNKQLNDSKNAD